VEEERTRFRLQELALLDNLNGGKINCGSFRAKALALSWEHVPPCLRAAPMFCGDDGVPLAQEKLTEALKTWINNLHASWKEAKSRGRIAQVATGGGAFGSLTAAQLQELAEEGGDSSGGHPSSSSSSSSAASSSSSSAQAKEVPASSQGSLGRPYVWAETPGATGRVVTSTETVTDGNGLQRWVLAMQLVALCFSLFWAGLTGILFGVWTKTPPFTTK